MKKQDIIALLKKAAIDSKIANVFMKYNENYYNLIPLKSSDKLFIAINEDDFIFDGFRISRINDVVNIRIKDDICDQILRNEGLFQDLTMPEVDIKNWQSVFESLMAIGKNVIVEYETAEGKDDNFTIGKIDRVFKSCMYMYHFDADGLWERNPYRIPYHEVTSVTFASRYINVFTKYISGSHK